MKENRRKKVLLVTLHSVNIGNRLQNFALQFAVEKKGCSVYNSICVPERFLKTKIKIIIKFMLYCVGVKKYYLRIKLSKKRTQHFNEFNNVHIHNKINIFFYNYRLLPIKEFDLAVAGSDQVWHNWYCSKKEMYYFYLMFMDKDKRASYAPSFGFSDVPECDKDTHKKGLSEMRYLSCREPNGADIIKRLTGRDALVVPDPTLLLSRDEWKTISHRPEYEVPEKYMLSYFLGDVNEQYNDTLNRLILERNCSNIDILNINDIEKYSTDPSEFLWLVEHADCICTDSFHACVFSIIFEKPFMVFPRIDKKNTGMDNMFDRIEHLLETFGLQQHIWENMHSEMHPITADDNINEKLKSQAKIGLDYLDKILLEK